VPAAGISLDAVFGTSLAADACVAGGVAGVVGSCALAGSMKAAAANMVARTNEIERMVSSPLPRRCGFSMFEDDLSIRSARCGSKKMHQIILIRP